LARSLPGRELPVLRGGEELALVFRETETAAVAQLNGPGQAAAAPEILGGAAGADPLPGGVAELGFQEEHLPRLAQPPGEALPGAEQRLVRDFHDRPGLAGAEDEQVRLLERSEEIGGQVVPQHRAADEAGAFVEIDPGERDERPLDRLFLLLRRM